MTHDMTKYFIISQHGYDTASIRTLLTELGGVRIADIFRNTATLPNIVYHNTSIVYPAKDIDLLTEQDDACVFMRTVQYGANEFIEGLSRYEYDNSDVVFLTVEQLASLPESAIDSKDRIVFVWLDSNGAARKEQYCSQKLKYNYEAKESDEQAVICDMVTLITTDEYLYFFNETPERVATILYTLVNYPELLDIYIKTFN